LKHLGIALAILILGLCFAQTTNTLTVTIPADVATAFGHAHAAEYAANKNRATQFGLTLTDDIAPSTAQALLLAEIATMIADKVQRYSPADLPARQGAESDITLRNRYQAQIKSKITVK
jgi:hypothetical protein